MKSAVTKNPGSNSNNFLSTKFGSKPTNRREIKDIRWTEIFALYFTKILLIVDT